MGNSPAQTRQLSVAGPPGGAGGAAWGQINGVGGGWRQLLPGTEEPLEAGERARRDPQRDQLVEGSALEVPLEEVGLGELLLAPPVLWVLEPARRWTTGFWAKRTPVGGEERRRRIS